MKISKIHIHQFNQFKDFELNLTYPKGHKKEGMPLDKVCFIGQSGTGKTTLLNLVYDFIHSTLNMRTRGGWKHYEAKEAYEIDFELTTLNKRVIKGAFYGDSTGGPITNYDNSIAGKIKKLIHFPVGLFNHSFDKNDNQVVNEPIQKYVTPSRQDYFLDLETLDWLWDFTFSNIQNYQIKEATFRLEQTHRLEKGQKIDFPEQIKKWREENHNPLEEIAKECLDPILNKFFLSVKTKIDDYKNRKIIQIQSTQNGDVIPYEKLSSGTRQIIYTAFPIYSLLEENSIVLIDEPENSLYPDIQKEIIEYYTSFDKDKKSQFFFATHSPIIASAFEPWEIVELKFDKDGNIYRELYFEGENNVDNYHTDARYLRWDGVLTKVFDLKEDSNVVHRSKKLMEFSILKKKIEKLKNEKDFDPKSKEVRDLIEELNRVGELLDWET